MTFAAVPEIKSLQRIKQIVVLAHILRLPQKERKNQRQKWGLDPVMSRHWRVESGVWRTNGPVSPQGMDDRLWVG